MSTFSKEAEQSVLGAIMLESSAWDAVSDTGIVESDFFAQQHQLIFSVMASLVGAGLPVDILTVGDHVESIGKTEQAGGLEYLSHLCDMTPTIDNAKTYAEIIVEHSRKRRFKQMGHALVDLADEGTTAIELEDFVSSETAKIATGSKKSSSMSAGQAAKALIEKIEKLSDLNAKRYTTGNSNLDSIWYPEPGRLHVIAGRPKMGKSTLAQNLGEANARDGVPVYYATMEMPEAEMAQRFVSSLGRVDQAFFKQLDAHPAAGEMWAKLSSGITQFKDLPIQIDFCPGATIAEITNRARAWFRTQAEYRDGGRGILVVDHIGLIRLPGKSNKVDEVGDISTRLKNLAGELRIPVVMLSQLNRGLEQRPNKRPISSDLRDSGRIEEDSDTITFVYRDEVYNEDSPDKGIAEIITTANRNGETGTVRVASMLKFSRFEMLAHGN